MKNILITILYFGCVSIAYSQTIRIAISSSPSNLSPFFSTDGNSQNILRLVHMSLIDFDGNMKIVCRLCEKYSQWKTSDKHHIRFKLKENINFSDGQNLTAQDVKKSWKYFTDSVKIKSIFRFAFSSIEKVLIHDKYDVELIYKKFDLSNFTNLTLFKIIKIDSYLTKQKIENSDILGAGEYFFSDINEMSIELSSNIKNLNMLKFIVVKDETTLALKLMGREIDLSIANISPRKLHWLKKNQNDELKFIKTAGSNYKYLGINHDNKFLKNRELRKALALLIPKAEIIKYKLKSTAISSTGFFSKAFLDYYRDNTKNSFDPLSAKKILHKLGYKLNKKKNYEKDGIELYFNIRTSSNKSSVEIATVISHFLNLGGVNTKVITSEWGSFMRALKSGRFDMVLGQWIGFAGPEMLKSVFHSKSIPPKGLNRGRYINKQFDKYIDLSVNSINKLKLLENYHKAVDIIDEDVPYINLWHPDIIWISRKCINLKNVYPNGSFLPLINIENECERKKI